MSGLQLLALWLPRGNAACNLLSALCLGVGYWAIKRRRVGLHRAAMLAALACSAVFLVGYLTRLGLFGSHRFAAPGPWRRAYLVMLISHMILAVVMLPMIGRALWLAWRGRFAQHRAIARRTWPIWMYVSLTGVLVFVALYMLDPYLVARAAAP